MILADFIASNFRLRLFSGFQFELRASPPPSPRENAASPYMVLYRIRFGFRKEAFRDVVSAHVSKIHSVGDRTEVAEVLGREPARHAV